MSKEKTRDRSKEKEKDELRADVELTEEDWLELLLKTREDITRLEESDETAVIVLPVTEEEEKKLEELARKAVEKLSRRFVWIAKRGRYGFMFVIPASEEDMGQWGAEWAGFTVDWCREMLLHIVSTRTLVMLDPFNDIRPDRHKAVKIILGVLVKEELGRWIDEAEGIIRVTWKTDDEWADEIRRWALKTGRTQFTLFKLQEYRKDLATLPKSELQIILQRLVARKQAKWLDSEHEVMEIHV
ncbi:MAG: hypothetical protein ACFFD8_08660 [Candidatus Thorarchaeota archaeon]